ncbi:MAG: RES family NAD+ phosphorylase [Bacteroidota bacterium]
MIVYRICKTYPPNHDPIDGEGAFISGGRWNPKGIYAVYTASTLALARSELARRLSLDNLPDGFSVYEIEVPEDLLEAIDVLPENWDSETDWRTSQKLGKRYLENNKIVGIKVPSVCDPKSANIILNPRALNFEQVKVKKNYLFKP